MFNRRNHKTNSQKVREFFWPSMGWKRTYNYYKHRVSRLSGTADAIACGLASGAAASFTPFVGFHIIIGVIITWTMRGNLIAAALGTLAGNPWTFPFIWVGTYKLGNLLLMGLQPDTTDHIPKEISFSTLWEHPLDLFVPMVVGGTLLAFFVWFIVFYFMRGVIHRYQRRRARRRRRRMIRRKLDMRRRKRKAARKLMEAAAREIASESSPRDKPVQEKPE